MPQVSRAPAVIVLRRVLHGPPLTNKKYDKLDPASSSLLMKSKFQRKPLLQSKVHVHVRPRVLCQNVPRQYSRKPGARKQIAGTKKKKKKN